VPGVPTDPKTTMGAIVSKAQREKIMAYVKAGHEDGAKLVLGGDVPFGARPAREQVFGLILSVIRWTDEDAMFDEVNAVDYGLTGAIHTKDLATAHRAANRVEAGYVGINSSAAHFLGAPFGRYNQSGHRPRGIDRRTARLHAAEEHHSLRRLLM
jgi:betaine-aldehyde dehydrogenase